MKTAKTVRVAILAVMFCSALLVAGCGKTPVSTSNTNNPEVTVALLFEYDGVKVYRFYDRSNPIYYTDARGATEWNEQHGRVSIPVRVETSR